MRNPFRRKKDQALDDLKARIREHEAAKELERKDMKELCFEIGRTLLTCAMVEKDLHDTVRYLGRSREEVANWLETGGDKRKLVQIIKEVRQRFGIDQAFFNDLDQFRRSRNRFVHSIWDISRSRLNSSEGRAETRAFVHELYLLGRHLNGIFAPIMMQHHGRILGWSDETINSFLPLEMRKTLSPPRL